MSNPTPQEEAAALAKLGSRYTASPDPFGWDDKLRRQEEEAGEAWREEEAERTEARPADEAPDYLYFSWNAYKILFALVTLAADPASSHVPYATPEQWAGVFKIRPKQAASALRLLSEHGIIPHPKQPGPIPLDGLLRFLADKIKDEEPDLEAASPEHRSPSDLIYFFSDPWIKEYRRIQAGGPGEAARVAAERAAAKAEESKLYIQVLALEQIEERSSPSQVRWVTRYIAQHGECGVCRLRVGLVGVWVSIIDIDQGG